MAERDIIDITRIELGESGGGKYVGKETWWDQQVQEAVKAKKEAFNNWRTAKIAVTKANYLAYEDMYEKNEHQGRSSAHLKVRKYQEKASAGHNRQHLCYDSRGNMLTEYVDIRNRWSMHYSILLNETNPKEQFQNVPETAGEVPPISVEEVVNKMAKMK